MALFSERYKYVTPREVLIREDFPVDIANGICSCFDELEQNLVFCNIGNKNAYVFLEEYLWVFFLNNRKKDFYRYGHQYQIVATKYLLTNGYLWYKKLDLIEMSIKILYSCTSNNGDMLQYVDGFVRNVNLTFKRLCYSYRVVNKEIVEITSDEEIKSVETALQNSKDNIRNHLSSALNLYAKRPVADYRNSIKESISAVEAYCRDQTGESTLGKSLNKMRATGCIVPEVLSVAFEKLYAYTNQPDTGIRHALMDDNGDYVPGQEEALFMLVSCSSFLNYLRCKYINKTNN